MDYCWDARELGARKLCGNGKSLVRSIIYQENSMCFFGGGPSSWNVYAMDQVETNIFQCISYQSRIVL